MKITTKIRRAVEAFRHGDDVVLEFDPAWSKADVPKSSRFAAVNCEINRRRGGGVLISPSPMSDRTYGLGDLPPLTVCENFVGTTAAEVSKAAAIIDRGL